MPSSALFTPLVPLERVFRLRSLIVSWEEIRVADEVFYPRYFGELTCKQFCGNLAPFQTLSEVATSSPSLLLGQFLLFVPKDGFFLLGHRVVELGIIPSCSAPCSAWMHVCVFVRRFGVTARI
ncbi:hypothetical protein F2Q69_00047176 [Brassica cretica]|uniref:Uncharacterized protein n=1 Tax=Brassica cretica TaxID=69181 RepID=A0A8S9Q353_BRACR|nr:hypothetical protein F2Q69_00047176 [Brassica cretica]